jgi:hypothetical protein
MSRTGILTAVLAAGALVALPASAALYKWTDANGRVVYSDQPPTAANVKAEVLNAPAPAANPNASKEMAQKDMELRKRQAERADAAAKSDKDRAMRAQRDQDCARIVNSVKQLSWGQVVIYRANEKGEQVPMDDAERAREKARLEGLMKELHCPA